MKNFTNFIKEIFFDIKDFYKKLLKTTKFISKKIFYYIQLFFNWMGFFFRFSIRFIFNIPIFLWDIIKSLFRYLQMILNKIYLLISKFNYYIKTLLLRVYEKILDLFNFIIRFFKYLWEKTIYILKVIFNAIKKTIINIPLFIFAILIFLIPSTILAAVVSVYYVLIIFIYALINKTDKLNMNLLIYIKPEPNVLKNLWVGYKYRYQRISSVERSIFTDEDRTFVKDIFRYEQLLMFVIIGIPMNILLSIIAIPFHIIISLLFYNHIPDDEKEIVDYIKNRTIIRKSEIKSSFLLVPIVTKKYSVNWYSNKPEIISNNGVLKLENLNFNNDQKIDVDIVCEITVSQKHQKVYSFKVVYDYNENLLRNTYNNIQLDDYTTEDIDFDAFKSNHSEIILDVTSKDPKFINNNGEIIKKQFNKGKRVLFTIDIKCGEHYIRKNVHTILKAEDDKNYLTSLLKKVPNTITVKRGRLRFINHYGVKVRYVSDEAHILTSKGYVYPSNYKNNYDIKVILSTKNATVSKKITLIRMGNKKGLRNELNQISVGKVKRDSMQHVLPKKTDVGFDGYSYDIEWFIDSKKVSNVIDLSAVIKKSYYLYLEAKIDVDGYQGRKKIKLYIPNKSAKFALNYDMEQIKLNLDKNNEFKLDLPKKGYGYKSSIRWISLTPTIISSTGKLRNNAYTKENKRVLKAKIKAVLQYKLKVATAIFKIEVKNGFFQLNQD